MSHEHDTGRRGTVPARCRNHERDWPGTIDRAVLSDSTDSGGECGVIYDKRMGLGMPIIKGPFPRLCNT